MSIVQPKAVSGQPMRKYYLALSALTIVIVAVILAVMIRELPLRHDRIMREQIASAYSAINTYADAHNKSLPTDLASVYIKNPPKNITYRTLDKGLFVLCAQFDKTYSYSSARYLDDTGNPAMRKAVDELQKTDTSASYRAILQSYDITHTVGKNCYVGGVSGYQK
jgi:hypothetical protein